MYRTEPGRDDNVMKNIIMNQDQHKSICSVLLLHRQTVCLNMFGVKTHLTHMHVQAHCKAKVTSQSTPLYPCERYTGSHESSELSSAIAPRC